MREYAHAQRESKTETAAAKKPASLARKHDKPEAALRPGFGPDMARIAIQPKSSATAQPVTEVGARPAAGSGHALPAPIQTQMETSFGQDFSAVRVHEGPHVQAMGALAYTQGTDLHFQPGLYQPGSRQGQELLGHELAHVVQQSAGRVGLPGGRGAPINADAGLEAEADRYGAMAARGARIGSGTPTVSASARRGAIQRDRELENPAAIALDLAKGDTARAKFLLPLIQEFGAKAIFAHHDTLLVKVQDVEQARMLLQFCVNAQGSEEAALFALQHFPADNDALFGLLKLLIGPNAAANLTYLKEYASSPRVLGVAQDELAKAGNDPEKARVRMKHLEKFNYDPALAEWADRQATDFAESQFQAKSTAINVEKQEKLDANKRTLEAAKTKSKQSVSGSGGERRKAERAQKAEWEQAQKTFEEGNAQAEQDAQESLRQADAARAGDRADTMELVSRLSASFPRGEIETLFGALGQTALKKVVDSLGVAALKGLYDAVGAGATKGLADSFGSNLKALHDSVGVVKLKNLTGSLTCELLSKVYTTVGSAKFKELTDHCDGPILSNLTGCLSLPQLKELANQFGADPLKRTYDVTGAPVIKILTDCFKVVDLKTLYDTVGTAGLHTLGGLNVALLPNIAKGVAPVNLCTVLARADAAFVLGELLPLAGFANTPTLLQLLVHAQGARMKALLEKSIFLQVDLADLLARLTTNNALDAATLQTNVFTQIKTRATNTATTPKQITTKTGTYTVSKYYSQITNDELEMLFKEDHASVTYESTFQTQAEMGHGGDTDEYNVYFWDDTTGAWQTDAHWVVHIHREKGAQKMGTATPAAHLKRYRERTFKDALRVPVYKLVVEECRKVKA